MPAAMIAIVSKSERRVHLDPAFGQGDGLTCKDGDEVRLLRMSQHGHMAEQATVVAKMLRRAGWRVSIRDCEDLPPKPVRVVGRQPNEYSLTPDMLTRAALQAGADLLATIGEARRAQSLRAPDFQPPEPPPAPVEDFLPRGTSRRRPSTHREVCMTCGHATTKGRPIRSHVENLGHTEFQTVAVEDIPRVQAQIRTSYVCTHAQNGAPEDARSASSASDQRVNGYTRPSDSEGSRSPHLEEKT